MNNVSITDESIETTFENDWLQYAKQSINVGIRQFCIPLFLSFIIADYFYAPSKMKPLVFIRLLGIPVTVFVVCLLNTSRNRPSFLKRYFVTITLYAFLIHGLIWTVQDPENIYFIGLTVIAAGAFGFVNVSGVYYLLISGSIFLPFFLYAYLSGMQHTNFPILLVYYFITLCLLVVYEFSRRNFNLIQKQEFYTRQSLNQVLAEKETTISKLANEITELNIRQLEYRSHEDTFKIARQIAHDIRSPLSAMNVASSKIREPEIAELVKMSTQRINDIAESMLQSSREILAKQREAMTSDVAPAIEAVLKEKKVRASTNIRIEESIEQNLPSVRVRRADLQRVLSNLLENSIEAIKGKGQIGVRATKDGNLVQIAIRDNGVGIPKDLLSQVGKYGFRYGKSNGSGLGLAYAYEVVESAGGEIVINSEYGKFTEVQLKFPPFAPTPEMPVN